MATNLARLLFLLLAAAVAAAAEWNPFAPLLFFGGGVAVAIATGGEGLSFGFLLLVLGLEMRCSPVSFYFRVGGSVASCGASFRSPVSVMADLFGVFLFLRWQKEEDGRHKKEGVSPLRLQECWPPFSGLLFSSLLLGVCLCTPSV